MKKTISRVMWALLLIGMIGLAFNIFQVESLEPPETEWNQTYGGAGDDYGSSVVQTSDGGYAFAGGTESFGAGISDFWLVKTDAVGNAMWNQTYGGTDYDFARSVIKTSDGGYALLGETESLGAGGKDFWLVKTDSAGNMEWNQTYGGTGDDLGFSVIQTTDGGYALTGYTNSFGAGNWDFWLVKTDPAGNMEWNQTYGGTVQDEAHSVIQASDGGYLMVGDTISFGAGLRDIWLVKTDPAGNIQWNQSYGGASWDSGHSVVEISEGGYTVAGATHSFGAGNYDTWLIRTYANGTMEWSKTYGGSAQDGAYSVVQTSDGGYIIAGDTHSFGAGYIDVWLVKTNSSGDMQWNKTYGGAGNDQAHSVVQTSDGGYAIAGFTSSYGAGGFDFWLIKVKAQASLNLTPNTGFAATTLVGSGFSLNATVTINWDDTEIPTVPSPLTTDEHGEFTAIISVLTQDEPGSHTVDATDEDGNWASATFDVIDMTGPPGDRGPQGPKGDKGDQGDPGEARELSYLVNASTIGVSIIAICLGTVGLLRKKTQT